MIKKLLDKLINASKKLRGKLRGTHTERERKTQ